MRGSNSGLLTDRYIKTRRGQCAQLLKANGAEVDLYAAWEVVESSGRFTYAEMWLAVSDLERWCGVDGNPPIQDND